LGTWVNPSQMLPSRPESRVAKIGNQAMRVAAGGAVPRLRRLAGAEGAIASPA